MADKTGYIGRSPSDSTTVIARQSFSVGISTDSFSFNSGYTPGYVDVYINGVKLIDVSDFSATDGSNITLLTAANNGDVVEVVAYKAFNIGSISDTPGNFNVGNVLTAQSGSVSGNFTVGGVLTYEDVNNVDSIGVITARTGVDVLAGGVDITGGGLKVVGVTSLTGNTVVSNNADVTISSGSSVTTAEHFYFNDGKKANFGNDSDLQIYHNDTSGYIDNNKGALYIRNNVDDDDGGNIIIQSKSGESAAVFQDDEGVRLYYDGSEKFATTGGGVDVTGITTSDGFYATSVGVGTALFVEGDARVTGILTVGTASISIDGNVSYPTIRPILDLNFAASKTLDRRITFTRDSVGTYVDENGLVKYASNNVPRFNHNPTTHESLGLLVEESRTNLLTYSDLLSGEGVGTGWANGGSTISKGPDVTAPDGTVSAWNTVYNGTSGDASLYKNGGEITTSNSTVYTLSVFAKVPSTNTYVTGIRVRTYNSNHSAQFNLVTGTIVGTTEGTTTNRMEAYPNGWYRCSITFTSGTDGNQGVQYYMMNPSNNTLLNDSNANGEALYLWGAQLEASAFPTSYIPTGSSAVTRDDDDAVIKGTNFSDIYNETEGTIFSEFNTKVNTGTTSKWAVSLRDPANNNNYIAVKTYAANMQALQVKSGGSSVADLTVSNSVVIDQFRRIAGSFKLNDFDAADDGTLLTGDTSGAMPTGITQMDIGRGWTSSNQKLEGHIKSIKYYRTKLPDAQLQGLTQQ